MISSKSESVRTRSVRIVRQRKRDPEKVSDCVDARVFELRPDLLHRRTNLHRCLSDRDAQFLVEFLFYDIWGSTKSMILLP